MDDTDSRRKDREEQREKQFSDNVLKAIRCELEALGPIYEQGIGGHVAPLVDGQILETRLALTQDWFAVFAANAIHLGRLDGKLSRRIVAVYALLKLLIEEFRINNDYLAAKEKVASEIRERPNEIHLQQRQQGLHKWMVQQAIRIKRTEVLAKAAVAELVELLDEAGIK